MELLLHYTWKHRLFPLKELVTTGGLPVEVIDPGLHNEDAGPDFFNAKLKIGEVMWVGNVELHQRSSEWYAHGHHTDRAYDNVVLHVSEEDDSPVRRSDGSLIPMLVLPVPEQVKLNYASLLRGEKYPPCYAVIPQLPRLTIHSFLSALQTERLTQKAELIEERRKRCGLNWEDAFFVTLARNFGFGVNGDAFEHWAGRIPLRAVDKHRDNLFQIEAIFLGQAGLLGEKKNDEYYCQMQHEYTYLSHKFGLAPMNASLWRFLRMRPFNFPHVRLAQLAALYQHSQGLLSRLLETATVDEACALFEVKPSDYWDTHYAFGQTSPRSGKRLSKTTRQLLVINTLAPFLYAYGHYKGEERLCLKAVEFLENIKSEDNRITRAWELCGIKVKSAADSQALIQLRRAYCDAHKCLCCRFGYEYLKRSRIETNELTETQKSNEIYL